MSSFRAGKGVRDSRCAIRALFETWEEEFPATAKSSEEWARYYASADFGRDFANFVSAKCLTGSESEGSLEALLQLTQRLSAVRGDDYPRSSHGVLRTAEETSPHEIVVNCAL